MLAPAARRIHHALVHKAGFGDTGVLAPTNSVAGRTETEDLTPEEINIYLTEKNHSADSLIAAYSVTYDTNYLKEAAEKYPDDPHVEFVVLRKDLFPEDRWHWLQAFKENAPDNSLANYLAASEYFREGKPEQAFAEMAKADAKPGLNVYWIDIAQAVSEAYISAGFAIPDARLEGIAFSPSPVIPLLPQQQFCHDISALIDQYQQSGNVAAANSLAEMELRLGERFTTGDAGKCLINEMTGELIQKFALGKLAPSTVVESDGTSQTAAERTAELKAKAQSRLEIIPYIAIDQLMASHTLSDDDVLTYYEHVKTDGELAALRWVRDKLGPNLPPHPSASERK